MDRQGEIPKLAHRYNRRFVCVCLCVCVCVCVKYVAFVIMTKFSHFKSLSRHLGGVNIGRCVMQ